MSQPTLPSTKISRKQRRRQQSPVSVEAPPHTFDGIAFPSTIMSNTTRLLVCSIGNPSPYLSTLHSAGHTVLSSLVSSLSYPPFMKSRSHGNGILSAGSEFTFWQSTSLMNISGKGVSAAWRQFQRENPQAKLVVVHDELELGLGQVKIRDGSASAKGHNGLKSINSMGVGRYTRIGVGIGRPESRDAGVVADYVLRKMSPGEKGKIEAAGGRVLEELRAMCAD